MHVEHAFVAGLADGTLPVSAFKYYLVQDYLFLVSILSNVSGYRLTFKIQFARANALAAYKAKTMEDIVAASGLESCMEFGLIYWTGSKNSCSY